MGVVAGLVPSTNPTSTVIYKTMICMKAGNPIIFSPHPSAVNCITETVNVLRRAVERAEVSAAGGIGLSFVSAKSSLYGNAARNRRTASIPYSSRNAAGGIGLSTLPEYCAQRPDGRLLCPSSCQRCP